MSAGCDFGKGAADILYGRTSIGRGLTELVDSLTNRGGFLLDLTN